MYDIVKRNWFLNVAIDLQKKILQHPVYCLNIVGAQNSHSLISISTDGKMCSWNLDMLSQPLETLELHTKQSKPIAATCLMFPHGDVNNFVVGSEEGTVYSGNDTSQSN